MHPAEFPNFQLADIAAVKALNAGTATPEQQKRALDFIMKGLCQIGGVCLDENPAMFGAREGKRIVGVHLANILVNSKEHYKALLEKRTPKITKPLTKKGE